MKFKKIYIEITNICNLSCHFCAQTNRHLEYMPIERFNNILTQIKPYTNYIYLHVMGEPLMHPKINEFIKLASERGFFVNLTTNGFLLDRLDESPKIRQLNISLHASKEQANIPLDDYLNKVFKICDKLSQKGTYINYRIWRDNCEDILDILSQKYQVEISYKDKTKTLGKNIFYSKENEFDWPINRLGEGSKNKKGTCLALRNHIAILVDGTVVPCCLDNNACIPLGNVFTMPFHKIITTPLYQQMLNGFKENKKLHPLCQNCNFYFNKIKN